MELGSQIRRYRSERGMSQDDLAGKIFVSTISNWENDSTYPDVQNLLLLFNLFDVTIDQLIKGDLDIMDKSIDSETKNVRRLGLVCGIFMVFIFLTLIVGFGLYVKLNKSDMILYAMLALVLITGILGIIATTYAEQIKSRNDVQTYREIKAFLSGNEEDRRNEPVLNESGSYQEINISARRSNPIRLWGRSSFSLRLVPLGSLWAKASSGF